jgi:hypothetical protein
MKMRRAAVAAAAVVVISAGVAVIEFGVFLGGESRGDAIAAAESQIPSTTRQSVMWAVIAPLVLFRGGASEEAAPGKEIVWVVRLSGTYPPASCGPVPHPGQQVHCPPDAHTATVILDYLTGRFVMASTP